MVGSARRGNLVLWLLAVVAFIWLVPVIWMVSMSLQPNEVLARTTSNTFLGLILVPVIGNAAEHLPPGCKK